MTAFIWCHEQDALGRSLARQLLDAGCELSTFVRGGATGAPDERENRRRTLAEAVRATDIVLTLFGGSQEVEDAYLGQSGIFDAAADASLFIDLSTSSPRLAKELCALATVHDHGFVEAPLELSLDAGLGTRTGSKDVAGADGGALAHAPADGGATAPADGDADAPASAAAPADGDGGATAPADAPAPDILRIFAAGEPDDLKRALPILRLLTPHVVEAGLSGSGMALKLASQIALAGALMGVVEAVTFASLAGVEPDRIPLILEEGSASSTVARALGQRILDEEFYYGGDLRQFFNELTCALDAANAFDLTLPGLETAQQLYDLLMLVGGGGRGIHALALIYGDEEQCLAHGIDWELAQRAMDVYERVEGDEDFDFDFDYDDEDDDEADCGHQHHRDDDLPLMGGYFSTN
ncbi:MAG: NAD(P)-dependent oxidoreductase [Coriobacteriales bacterium]|jgi:3-hydroxyisobutyrate dehydrogenase|nr:NAD(P)-dependent oxidoreductase [Coriobacteriales bacterium]